MQNLKGKRMVITCGSQGGPGAHDGRGDRCLWRERDRNWPRANLSTAENAGAAAIAGDATDSTLLTRSSARRRPMCRSQRRRAAANQADRSAELG